MENYYLKVPLVKEKIRELNHFAKEDYYMNSNMVKEKIQELKDFNT
mgnify:CR=1 FL=1